MARTPRPRPGLDKIDRAIIEHLQSDGRAPYTKLSAAVGLSEAAVRQRVQRLLENGVIQVVAVTDPLQLGYRRMAMIGVRAEGDLNVLAEKISAIAEVAYVVVTAGSFDLLVEAVVEDDERLLDLVNDRFRALPGVRSTETFIYLRIQRQSYAWGAF
jgi:Lrp/AsnC family transcriptional regulator, regulator for asnA, asnC and gidA